MHTILAALLTVTGALQVWTESPLVRVYPESVRGKHAHKNVRLTAACGEKESFQLCLRPEKEDAGRIAVEVLESKTLPPPDVRCIGYLALDAVQEGKPPLVPDPLLDYVAMAPPAGKTVAYWVTCTVPRDARPGRHRARLLVKPERGKPTTVSVTIEVYHFMLPARPSLRSLFPLDRASLVDFYALDETALDAWKPVYDALADARISWSLWDAGPLVAVGKTMPPAADALKEHLAYAVENARMNTIDIGPGPAGLAMFPETADLEQDPLALYLRDMHDWLAGKQWLDRAVVETGPLPQRDQWPDAQHLLLRVKRADPRSVRLLCSAPHPAFEEYTELWALPASQHDPNVLARLNHGMSLTDSQSVSVSGVEASSTASLKPEIPIASAPADACDGCLFTAWMSADTPSAEVPQWLEVRFRKAVGTERMRIIWRNGFEAAEFKTYIEQDTRFVPLTDAVWTPYPPAAGFGQSWAEAKLPRKTYFTAIRLDFARTFAGGPVGVTEIVPLDPEVKPCKPIGAVECWMHCDGRGFPNLAADGQPLEPRLAPWVCFHNFAAGFVSRGLNAWPPAWKEAVATPPYVWTGAGRGDGFLYYPGPKGLMPSIRSEMLRDGMEDYEYVAALESVALKGEIKDKQMIAMAQRIPAVPLPRDLMETRNTIGKTLDAIARKKK